MIRWLLTRFWNRHDPAWASTGIKHNPGMDAPYSYATARSAALKARTRTESGRKYKRPAKPTATVVDIRRRRA